MGSAAPFPAPKSAPATEQEDRLKHLPAEARAAFQRFQATRAPAELDVIIFAILDDFIPKEPVSPLARLPGATRLIDDLGFDSLAITELVFFTEELFNINISNQEIIQVHTLDDLRGFIGRKVASGASA